MPLAVSLLITAAIAGGLGLVVGWLMGRNRPLLPPDGRLENELRQQVSQRETELARLRGELAEAGNARAAAEAGKTAAEKIAADQRALHERALGEAKQMQAQALTDLRETFKALSADALKASAPDFLRLAEQSFGKLQETAKGDLAQRQEAIKGLVEPLKQQLETYQKRLQQSETAQAASLGEVKKHLETLAVQSQTLAQETQQFRMVLHSNQARGRWGEETLRRVVEVAGLSTHCDFTEQTQVDDKKPDLIVRLPGDRIIIVDAKVPDLDFLNAADTAEPAKRTEALAQHAAKLKQTIRALADRDYPSQFPTALDYVVLFLPAESLFSAALEGDRDLMVWAQSRRIILATPSSLIAILRSVSLSWQQHAQTENAQQIAAAAREFYARMVKFTEHFEKIRAGLDRANTAFNDATASFQSRVRPAGERLADLGGSDPAKPLPEIEPLHPTLRLPLG